MKEDKDKYVLVTEKETFDGSNTFTFDESQACRTHSTLKFYNEESTFTTLFLFAL